MNLSDSRILITGGAGFIGSHLVETLITKGNEVVILDSFRRNSIRYLEAGKEKVRIVRGDVTNPADLKDLVTNTEYVFHLAGVAGIDTVTKSPVSTMKTNLIGTYNLLEALVSSKGSLKRLVFASTSEVYGPMVYLGKEDDLTSQGSVAEPRWTYSTSKLASEHFIQSYHSEFGIPTTIVRPFNIYGPRQTGEGAIHNFVVAALSNKPLKVYGNGFQIRAWCYVSDAIQALVAAGSSSVANGRVFNVGNPNATVTVLMLAEIVKRISESNSPIQIIERPMTDVQLRIPDIGLAIRLLGFRPKVTLEEGIGKTVSWYRRNEMQP